MASFEKLNQDLREWKLPFMEIADSGPRMPRLT
jgi:hypothetical protein